MTSPRCFVLLSLLLSFPISISATLVPGSEKALTASVPDVAAFDQRDGRIATDGNAFLTVWVDNTTLGQGDIHGMRLSSEGKRVDAGVLPIAVTDTDDEHAEVAFGGNRYFVVWATQNDLRARFVGRDGVLSDVIVISTPINGPSDPHVAFNGTRFLVTWTMTEQFHGALIDPDGTIVKKFVIASTLQTSPLTTLVAANGVFQFITAIVDFNGVPTGNGFPSDVGATPISNDGVVGTRVVLAPAATPVFDLRAASSGSEYLVGWTTALLIPDATVRNVRVTPSGVGAVDVIPANGLYLQDVVADSEGFLIFYGAEGTKYVRRPGAREPFRTVSTPATQTAITDSVTAGARTIVLLRGLAPAGSEFGPAGSDVYATRLDTNEIEPLALAPRHQSAPDIAAAGDLKLAVWCEYIGSERRLSVVAARIDANGNSLDANGIDLHASFFAPLSPRVASNGTDWLVVWADRGFIRGSRIKRDGTLLDVTPIEIASSTYSPAEVAVAWDGAQYVVVFARGFYFRQAHTVMHARRVTTNGAIDPQELALSNEGANEFPAITSNGQLSAIVWRSGSAVQGALLTRGNTMMPLAFVAQGFVSQRPEVAWNGDTFLVAAPVLIASGYEVQWFLVSESAVVHTPITEFVDTNEPASPFGWPTIELQPFGEDGFLMFWTASANVLAARINGEGVLADGPQVVATTVVDTARTIGAAGNTLVYTRRIGHPTRDIARVFAKDVQYTPGKPRRRAAGH